MKTLIVEFKHTDQIGNGMITASNKIKSELTGSLLDYWNRYQDEQALDFLAKKLLEFEYPTKYKSLIVTSRTINK